MFKDLIPIEILWLCSILNLAFDMGHHYHTFIGTKLEYRKNLMPLRITNTSNMNSTIIVNGVDVFGDSASMNSTLMNNMG